MRNLKQIGGSVNHTVGVTHGKSWDGKEKVVNIVLKSDPSSAFSTAVTVGEDTVLDLITQLSNALRALRNS